MLDSLHRQWQKLLVRLHTPQRLFFQQMKSYTLHLCQALWMLDLLSLSNSESTS